MTATTTTKTRTKRNTTKTPPTPLEAGIDQYVKERYAAGQPITQDDLGDLVRQFSRRVIEAVLQGEMDAHLQGIQAAPDTAVAAGASEPIRTKRNGFSEKTIKTQNGEVQVRIPRDRANTYEPLLIPKHSRTLSTLNEQIIAMYGRGMSTRDIQAFVADMYGMELSADYVSTVTDRVLEDVKTWQNRPLESMYPVAFFDALRVKIRSGTSVKNMAVHIGIGVRGDGTREVLGIWMAENEGAAFWASVFNGLKARGVQDILIAVTDGLKGMTQALEASFPQTMHQTCIVHLIRSSTAFISHKDRPEVCKGLKSIYQAVDAEAAEQALTEFEQSPMGERYPVIAQAWRRAWGQVVPFFMFPPEIRTLIYTTNAIEGLNRAIRKVIKTRTLFPTEDAAKKLIYLAITNYTKNWKRPSPKWSAAMRQFALMFGERFTSELTP